MDIQLKEHHKKRFWDKVLTGEPNDCWNWIGGTNRPVKGYGVFYVDGFFHTAHRVAYTIMVGPIQGKNVVMHKCDNPLCCNPSHLYQGSQARNVWDFVEKGRGRRSEVLTLPDVEYIRSKYRDSSISQTDLAKEMGVSQTYISQIVRGRNVHTREIP